MARRRRFGFTLVELLVVITIIGMLMALLLPAVNAVRENARRTQCSNNMRQIATAAFNYVSSKEYFPGYRGNRAGSSNQVLSPSHPLRDASWFVAITPQLEQSVIKDRYDVLLANPTQIPYVEFAVCPSDPPEQLGPTHIKSYLAYVVNSGRADPPQLNLNGPSPDHEANGVFHDLRHPKSPKLGINMDDGITNTLMLSESIQASNWSHTDQTQVTFIFQHIPERFDQEGRLLPRFQGAEINGNKNSTPPVQGPSSNHSGGVNVAFCDGRTMFLSEEIHYGVLQQLMTPDGYNPACDVPPVNKGYILSASDYSNQ